MSIDDPKTIFETAITETVASGGVDKEQVGTVRHGRDGKIYRWVQNTHSADLAVGDVVFHDGATDSTNMYKYVEDGATAALMFMAGVAISAIPSNGFGWIQIDGITSAFNFLGATAGGTALAVGDTVIGVNGQTYTTRSEPAGDPPVYSKYIVALETVATATTPAAATIAGMIKCF